MVTDEIFAVSCAGRHEITPRYFYALMSIPWISWTIGTLLGATANTLLPLILRNALGLAIKVQMMITNPLDIKDNALIYLNNKLTIMERMITIVICLSCLAGGMIIPINIP